MPRPALRLVLELVEHLHDVLDRRAGALGVAVVERLAVDDVALAHGEAGGAQHAHLLGLVVVDRRLRLERVEVVVGERLLRHRRAAGAATAPAGAVGLHAVERLAHAIELAGDELQLRVAERRAAAVGQRDPAVDVGRLVVARDGQHVVGVPRQLRRQIRRLDAMPRRAFVVERPDQRRPRVEIAGQLREADVIGMEAR